MFKSKYTIVSVIVGIPIIAFVLFSKISVFNFIIDIVDNPRAAISDHQRSEIHKLTKEGKYRCCLNTPCTYCFVNSSIKNDNMICDCLDEVVSGEVPCGECVGEILEGNGNKYLTEYFPEIISKVIYEYNNITI